MGSLCWGPPTWILWNARMLPHQESSFWRVTQGFLLCGRSQKLFFFVGDQNLFFLWEQKAGFGIQEARNQGILNSWNPLSWSPRSQESRHPGIQTSSSLEIQESCSRG